MTKVWFQFIYIASSLKPHPDVVASTHKLTTVHTFKGLFKKNKSDGMHPSQQQ